MDEAESGEFCTRVGAKCGRWNPTADQVKVLTDLFRSGLRTPSTDQIQMISAHLSSFGKIESKNVFYWFQNHKARERHHKKRRRSAVAADPSPRVLAPASRYCMTAEQGMTWEEGEREVRTLELFPLTSYNFEMEKMRTVRNECKEIPFLDGGREMPLDLRLSFL